LILLALCETGQFRRLPEDVERRAIAQFILMDCG
jgi:hypothetical protein